MKDSLGQLGARLCEVIMFALCLHGTPLVTLAQAISWDRSASCDL